MAASKSDSTIFGLEVDPIEVERFTPVHAIVLVIGLDLETDEETLCVQSSDGVGIHLAYGMLADALDMTKQEMRENG